MRSFWRAWVPAVLTVISSGGLLFLGSWWLATHAGARLLGLVLGVGGTAALAGNALLGPWIDRTPRSRVMVLCQVVLIVGAAAHVAVLDGPPTPAHVAVVAALQVVVMATETVYFAGVELLSIDLAPVSWPRRRLSLLGQVPSQLDRIASPVFAGALIGSGHALAVPPAAVAVVLGSLLATRAVRAVRVTLPHGSGRSPAPGAQGASVRRLLRDSPSLVYLLLFGAWSNLAVFPLLALLPAYYGQLTQPGPQTAVWASRAMAGYAVGMTAATVAIARRPTEPDAATALRHATLAHLLICALLGAAPFSHHPAALATACVVTGGLFAILVAAGGQIWLELTPADVRARVLSLKRLIAFSTIPFGTALLGGLGDAFTLPAATSGLAFVSAALTVITWLVVRPASRPSCGRRAE